MPLEDWKRLWERALLCCDSDQLSPKLHFCEPEQSKSRRTHIYGELKRQKWRMLCCLQASTIREQPCATTPPPVNIQDKQRRWLIAPCKKSTDRSLKGERRVACLKMISADPRASSCSRLHQPRDSSLPHESYSPCNSPNWILTGTHSHESAENSTTQHAIRGGPAVQPHTWVYMDDAMHL